MITPADLKIRYPEFADIDDPRIQFFIDDAILELDVNRWGDYYDKGLAALTAHFLINALKTQTVLGAATIVGNVSSRSVGSVSTSFNAPVADGSNTAYYQTSKYGQEYLRLLNIIGSGMVAIGS